MCYFLHYDIDVRAHFIYVNCPFHITIKETPRFLAYGVEVILSSPILTLIVPAISSCCLVPSNSTSVLLSFNFSRLTCIHVQMSLMQFSKVHKHRLLLTLFAGEKLSFVGHQHSCEILPCASCKYLQVELCTK